jgi:hypothetical protein
MRTSSKIGFKNILLHHPVSVEKGAVEGNCMSHDLDVPVPVTIEQGKDSMLQFTVK